MLSVAFKVSPLCQITVNGGVRYRAEDVDTEVMSDALDKVTSFAVTTAEYMRLMEKRTLEGLEYLVICGAYSVDKLYRLSRGYGWWGDEQPSDEIKAHI